MEIESNEYLNCLKQTNFKTCIKDEKSFLNDTIKCVKVPFGAMNGSFWAMNVFEAKKNLHFSIQVF